MAEDFAPRVLLAHTFEHDELCERVDEIRFSEAVLISACEILELQGASACSNAPVLGETNPTSFPLEIFARIHGESRFRSLCPAFIYSPTSAPLLDLEVTVTDHMVLRGIYSTLTLVIYGTPVRELKLGVSIDAPLSEEPVSPVSQPAKSINFRLDSPLQTTDFAYLLWKLVRLANVSPKAREGLVTAALAYRKMFRTLDRDSKSDSILSAMTEVADKGNLYEEHDKEDVGSSESKVLDMVMTWIQNMDLKHINAASEVNHVLAGLATIQLLCISTTGCFKFVSGGGIGLLIKVLQIQHPGYSIATTLALQALETSSRHAFGCEEVVGWMKHQKLQPNYAALLLTLVRAERPSVIHMSVQLLHRFRVYELAATFQAAADALVATASTDLEETELSLLQASKMLKVLTTVLHLKNDVTSSTRRFRWVEFEDDGLPQDGALGNVDEHILVILQERRLLSSIAAFIAAPTLWDLKISKNRIIILLEVLETIQSLILSLLISRSGILLLFSDSEAAEVLSAILETAKSIESFSSYPWNIEKLLQTSLSVVDIFNQLHSSALDSKDYVECLSKLLLLSRTHAGRQAIGAMLRSTEEFMTLIEVLRNAENEQSSPEILLSAYYAAETVYAVLSDSTVDMWTCWILHATKLKGTLPMLNVTEDETCESTVRLRLVMDVTLDKGAVGLLKYAAFILGENSTFEDFDQVFVAEAGSLLGKVSGSSGLNYSAVIQLTACLHILASVCGSSISAALIGEGAVAVLSALLERTTFMLQDDFENDDLSAFSTLASVVNLLVPALLLLLTLFHRLQLEKWQYHNTKLALTLLNLHSALSGKYTLVPPSRESGEIKVQAVLRLLAAVLAYWVVFSWDPAMQARIFGIDDNTSLAQAELPLDPLETCSALILLGNLLPSNAKRNCWDLAVITTLGAPVLSQVTWHTQTPFKESLLDALGPHIHHLGDLIARLALSTCEVLRDLLRNIVIELLAASPSRSSAILRPLLCYIEERICATSQASDIDHFHVLCCINFVTELAAVPASKALILQDGTINIFCQGLLNLSSFRTVEASSCTRSLLVFFTTILDTMSFVSADHCRLIYSTFSIVVKVLPLENDFELFSQAFFKFLHHRQGKVAFLNMLKASEIDTANADTNKKSKEFPRDHNEPFLVLSKRLFSSLNVNDSNHGLVCELTRSFAFQMLRLTAVGKSLIGMGALSVLFGRCFSATDDNQIASVAISDLISVLNEKRNFGSDKDECAQQAADALQVVLRLLQKPIEAEKLLKKVMIEIPQKQAGEHKRITSVVSTKDVDSMLEKFKDRFTWECSTDVLKTAIRKPKRKPFLYTGLSKRLRLSAKASRPLAVPVDDETCVDGDAPELDDVFGNIEKSSEADGSPTDTNIFSSFGAYKSSPEDFHDNYTSDLDHLSNATASTPSSSVHPYPVYSYGSFPPPLPPSLATAPHLVHTPHQGTHFQQSQQQISQEHIHYQIHAYHQQLGQLSSQSQHESWSDLQQILASPEAIQDLLRDQTRLTRLLEQHPRLLSLLQERFNFSS